MRCLPKPAWLLGGAEQELQDEVGQDDCSASGNGPTGTQISELRGPGEKGGCLFLYLRLLPPAPRPAGGGESSCD